MFLSILFNQQWYIVLPIVYTLWKIIRFYYTLACFPTSYKPWISPNVFKQWFETVRFLFQSDDIVQSRYQKARGSSFTIATPENNLVLVSSKEQVTELLAAPQGSLSFHAIITEMFRPKHTMAGMELHDDCNENDPNVHLRALRVLLPRFYPLLQDRIREIISDSFQDQMKDGKARSDGWIALEAQPLISRMICRINSMIFVGEPLASDPKYLEAALNYPMDVFRTCEIIRLLPDFLSWPVAAALTRNGRNIKTIRGYLFDLVRKRREQNDPLLEQSEKPLDVVQWLMDSIPKSETWTDEKIVSKIQALWFGSVHLLAMTLMYALYDLCQHPECVDPIRAELADMEATSTASSIREKHQALDRLHFLDSFLKESARLHPSTNLGVRRKAVVPYTFKDGTSVAPGDWVCIPGLAMQKDPQYYVNPETFDGFRFLPKLNDVEPVEKSRSENKAFTDIDISFSFWGMGKRACPGRYHASWVMKLIITHIMTSYEMKLENPKAATTFAWGAANPPMPGTRLLFRKLD